MMYDWRVWVGSLVLSACWWLLLSTEINIVWDYYWAVWEGVMLTIGG